jgi:hypothetical protein
MARSAVIVLLSGLALGSAGCGASTRPVWCPTSSTPVELAHSRPSHPAEHSFDARRLLGQTEGTATRIAERWGCFLRVTDRDGHQFILTSDFRTNRIDVVIVGNVITQVGIG